MNEFEMITNYFAPLTMGRGGSAQLRDDAAVLDIPEGRELVVTSDTLNEGVHFLDDEAPENIAHKALRSNLSDLAAMGAKALCYQLCLSFPDKPEPDWLAAFTGALLDDQKIYGLYCSGGDTTSLHGKLSVTITAFGTVPKGKALRRGGAKSGDAIVLTGAIGDAYLGLKSLQDKAGERYSAAISRYRVPQPRLQAAPLIRSYAHAACDVSDGFLADIDHICEASGVGAKIECSRMEFSPEVKEAIASGYVTLEQVLSGGDDYELVLAIPQKDVQHVLHELKKIDLNPFVAGSFEEKTLGLSIFDTQRNDMSIKYRGWKHFS